MAINFLSIVHREHSRQSDRPADGEELKGITINKLVLLLMLSLTFSPFHPPTRRSTWPLFPGSNLCCHQHSDRVGGRPSVHLPLNWLCVLSYHLLFSSSVLLLIIPPGESSRFQELVSSPYLPGAESSRQPFRLLPL